MEGVIKERSKILIFTKVRRKWEKDMLKKYQLVKHLHN
jgi:hypothetical protein